jgi:hypothetical protein
MVQSISEWIVSRELDSESVKTTLVTSSRHSYSRFFPDAARSKSKRTILFECRDDVTSVVFTLYELVTNDTSFSDIPHSDRHIDPDAARSKSKRTILFVQGSISRFRGAISWCMIPSSRNGYTNVEMTLLVSSSHSTSLSRTIHPSRISPTSCCYPFA